MMVVSNKSRITEVKAKASVDPPVPNSKKQRAAHGAAIFKRYWIEQDRSPKRRQAANRMKAKLRDEKIVIRRLQKLAVKKAEPVEEVEMQAA